MRGVPSPWYAEKVALGPRFQAVGDRLGGVSESLDGQAHLHAVGGLVVDNQNVSGDRSHCMAPAL